MAHETPVLDATRREKLGTRYTRRLRRDGQMPAVVYGHGQDPAHVAFNAGQFMDYLHDGTHLLEIKTADVSDTCLIKDVQYDFLGTTIIHVDLTRINLNEEVEVTVSIEVKGKDKAPGANEANAVVEQPVVDIVVRCLANNIPAEIIVDMSKMEMGDVILVRDLVLPEGVTTDENEDDVIVSISEAKELEEDEVGDADSAEPEVIGAKPDDGDDDDKDK